MDQDTLIYQQRQEITKIEDQLAQSNKQLKEVTA
jgi:hypothetical protein